MKHFLILTIIWASLLLSACTPENKGAENKPFLEQDVAWQEIQADTITLESLTPDSIYSIQVKDNGSRNLSSTSESSYLHPTKVGTYLLSSKDGQISFSLNDIKATVGDKYHISRLDGTHDMKIEEQKDFYIPYIRDGKEGKLYEEFYLIDTEDLKNDGLDINNIVICDSNSGGGEKYTDYGLILDLEEFNLSQDPKSFAVIDLAGYENIGIYNSLFLIESRNNNVSKEVKLVNPVTLTLNESKEITDKNTVFRVDAESLEKETEYVLKITPQESMSRDNYAISMNNPNPRFADSGMRRPYLFPINNSDSSILIYIGEIDKEKGDFIFDFNVNVNNTFNHYGSVEIVPLSGNMTKPETINLTNNIKAIKEFDVNEGDRTIIPFIIRAENEDLLSDFDLYFECTDENCNLDDEIRMFVISALDKGFGYAQTPVWHKENAEVWATDILEFIYFEINGPSENHHIVLHSTK